jgi:vacuolar-type H+-ATPase subunit I/STV1
MLFCSIDLADKSSEFLNDAKSILSGLGESIEDIDIKVPEMNIKLSDLVNDVLASAKDKTRSINHIFNSAFPAKPAEEVVVVEKKGQDTEAKDTSTNNSSLQAIQEMKQSMMEEEEEEIDEEALAQDAAARMKNQDYQFMLLCRKFANIRNTLISINHRVIPFIPSIVMIGSRHIQQDNGISVLESILGQPFLTR